MALLDLSPLLSPVCLCPLVTHVSPVLPPLPPVCPYPLRHPINGSQEGVRQLCSLPVICHPQPMDKSGRAGTKGMSHSGMGTGTTPGRVRDASRALCDPKPRLRGERSPTLCPQILIWGPGVPISTFPFATGHVEHLGHVHVPHHGEGPCACSI